MTVSIGTGLDYDTIQDYLDALVALTEPDFDAIVVGATAQWPITGWAFDSDGNLVTIEAQTKTNGIPGTGCKMTRDASPAHHIEITNQAEVKLIGFEIEQTGDYTGYSIAATSTGGTKLTLERCLVNRLSTNAGGGGLVGANFGCEIRCTDCFFNSNQVSMYVGVGAFTGGSSLIILKNCKFNAPDTTTLNAGINAFFWADVAATAHVQMENVHTNIGGSLTIYGPNVDPIGNGYNGNNNAEELGSTAYPSLDYSTLFKDTDTSSPDLRWVDRDTALDYPGADLSADNDISIEGRTRVSLEDKSIAGGDLPYFPPIITTTTLPDGIKNDPYSETVEVTSSSESLTFTITSGSLPTGLTIDDETGEITGTPTAGGSYSFTVTVEDGDGQQDAQALSIDIVSNSIFITPNIGGSISTMFDAGSNPKLIEVLISALVEVPNVIIGKYTGITNFYITLDDTVYKVPSNYIGPIIANRPYLYALADDVNTVYTIIPIA